MNESNEAARSWRVMIRTASCPPDGWTGNGMRYASRDDALEAGRSLSRRWTAVTHWDVVSSADEPNA